MPSISSDNAFQPSSSVWVQPDYLAEMDADGECDLLNEVITLFIAEGERRIESLRNAASVNDFETLAWQGHAFRGSALQLNATSLARLSEDIEQTAVARRPDDYLAVVKRLETVFHQVCEAMAAYRNRVASRVRHSASELP